MTDTAIKINDLGKMYRFYQHPADKVLDAFGINRWLFWRKQYYQEFWALRGLNLEVKKGERLGIIGRNGAGKSTLLKIITGNVAATEGMVEVNGRVQALMELGTGFHPEFTGRQNIRASLAYQGLTSVEIQAKEEEIIDFSELDEFIDQPIKTYSAGMYARLAFTVATVVEPEILIIDEVLGAGDAYFASKCVERMQKLTEESGATVLFVSHDLSSVQRLCSQVIWIKNGKILMYGKAHEVLKEYINNINHETEIRLRARDMRLSKKEAKTIINNEKDIYTKLLFRLHTDRLHPHKKHIIYQIKIVDGNSTIVAEINVGSPMDNSTLGNNYIIENHETTDWSSTIKKGNRFYRCYANVGGKDGHAPFVLSVPTYQLMNQQNLTLEILHSSLQGEKVYVELFQKPQYHPVGILSEPEQLEGISKFNISKFFNTHLETESEELEQEELEDSSYRTNQPVKSILNNGLNVRDDNENLGDKKICYIRKVEFILKNSSKSVKVVPISSWLRVDIYYEAVELICDPVFAITFHRIDGCQMDHKNNKILQIETGTIQGRGRASFIFDPLRLGPGEYVVSAAILKFLSLNEWYEVPPSYDRHDRQYSLFVHTNWKNLGAVVQESSFILEKDTID